MQPIASEKHIFIAVRERALVVLLRMTAFKCFIGVFAILAIYGWSAVPVSIAAVSSIAVVLRNWNTPYRAYPAALWLSSVFWLSSSILVLLDKPFTLFNLFGFFCLGFIGTWDVFAARTNLEEI
jgi:hypothetical protein